MPENRYKEIRCESQEIKLDDKLEVGGHPVTVIGIDKSYRSGEESNYVIIHGLDLVNRVYEVKFQWAHGLTIYRKVTDGSV